MSTMKFTSWQDLDGNEVANSAYPPGLVLIKSVDIGSAVSSVTVNDCFSSDFSNYRVMMKAADSNANVNWMIRFGSVTTGYYSALDGHRFNGTTVNDTTSNDQHGHIGAVSTGRGGSFAIDIFDPYASEYTMWQGQNVYPEPTYGWTGTMSGVQLSTTQFTGFTVEVDIAATITGGTIRVYGYSQ